MAENAQMMSPPAFSDAAGQEYSVVVSIQPNGSAPFVLDTGAILQFDYQMQLNDLVTRGSLTYVDSAGKLDDLICRPYGVMHMLFSHSVYDAAEQDGQFPPILESDPANPDLEFVKRIDSDFLIESVGIVERNMQAVVYKLEFTSVSIVNCIGTVDFSNYGKKPEPVLDILKQIAQDKLGVEVDADSFGCVRHQPSMNYITNGNDNLFTSAKFLLDKLYYRFPRSEAMVFVFWDELDHRLKLFDMSNSVTVVGQSKIVLAMFDQFLEQAGGGVHNELGTVTKFPASKQATIDYDNQIATYDYGTNALGYDNFSASQARQYINARFAQLYDCEDKYQGISLPGAVNYKRRGSFWNNDFHFYGMFMDAFLNSNALLVKTAGSIGRIPGCMVEIYVDKGDAQQYSEDPALYDEMMRRYKGLNGAWVVTKIHNYVKPNAGKVESFRQVLTLARNFVQPVDEEQTRK